MVVASMYLVRANCARSEYTGISMSAPGGAAARARYTGAGGGTGWNSSGTTCSAAVNATSRAAAKGDRNHRLRTRAMPIPASTHVARSTTTPKRLGARISENAGNPAYSSRYKRAVGPNDAHKVKPP